MPKVIVKSTTVYTLSELREMDKDAYDKAIEQTLEYANADQFYCDMLSEDLRQWFVDGPGDKSINESPFDDGDVQEWDYDRRTLTFTFKVYMHEYMKRNRLIGKYRALDNFCKMTGDFYLTAKVEAYRRYNDSSPLKPLPYDFANDVEYDIEVTTDDPKRRAKLIGQVEEVCKHIAGSAEWVRDFLMKWIKDDIEYRYSEEFAVEEAEAQELTFLANGRRYH